MVNLTSSLSAESVTATVTAAASSESSVEALTERQVAARQQLAAALKAASSSSSGVQVSSSTGGPNGLTSVWIQDGAHHVDLFFSNPADPASITSARQVELGLVRSWIADWYAAAAAAA